MALQVSLRTTEKRYAVDAPFVQLRISSTLHKRYIVLASTNNNLSKLDWAVQHTRGVESWRDDWLIHTSPEQHAKVPQDMHAIYARPQRLCNLWGAYSMQSCLLMEVVVKNWILATVARTAPKQRCKNICFVTDGGRNTQDSGFLEAPRINCTFNRSPFTREFVAWLRLRGSFWDIVGQNWLIGCLQGCLQNATESKVPGKRSKSDHARTSI